jgi:hypothetical protein
MQSRLLVTANLVPSSPILVTLKKEALSSSETSVLTRATRRNIQEGAILQAFLRYSTENNNHHSLRSVNTKRSILMCTSFVQNTTRWRGKQCLSYLRYFAISQDIAGSISENVIDFFKLPNPSRRNRPSDLLSL